MPTLALAARRCALAVVFVALVAPFAQALPITLSKTSNGFPPATATFAIAEASNARIDWSAMLRGDWAQFGDEWASGPASFSIQLLSLPSLAPEWSASGFITSQSAFGGDMPSPYVQNFGTNDVLVPLAVGSYELRLDVIGSKVLPGSGSATVTLDVEPIPEPATITMLALGCLGCLGLGGTSWIRTRAAHSPA